MSVARLQVVSKGDGEKFVPPTEDYDRISEGWEEAEYRCYEGLSGKVVCAHWEGEPGSIGFRSWPYDEICVIKAGRVAVVDEQGGRREFSAGDAFVVPKGFAGTWETLEPSQKIFIGIDVAGL